MARVTAKDVAKLAGVDQSAVSRVLNKATENHKYSEETINRIRSAAAELGYKPSMTAKALRTGRSMLIGMIVPDIGNPFFATIASHIEQLAWREGYRVVVCSSNENADRQAAQMDDLVSRGVDGLIIAPAIGGKLPDAKAVVAIDRPSGIQGIPSVSLDNRQAGLLLGRHLAERGYRRVGVVFQDFKGDPTMRLRLDGFVDGVGEAAVAWQAAVPFSTNMIPDAQALTVQQLTREPLPDAVVGLSNWCTLGALEAMAERHLEWGAQIGLGGIDDFSGADLMKPGITVVAQPVEQLAGESFSLLYRLMNEQVVNKNRPEEAQWLAPVLISRDSLPKRDAQ